MSEDKKKKKEINPSFTGELKVFKVSILGHMKTCFSSKSFVPQFVDFSCKQYVIWEYPAF